MTEDRRQFYRITPHALSGELTNHREVMLLDISLGGAKFKVLEEDAEEVLAEEYLLLDLGNGTSFTLSFEVKEHNGNVYRVGFNKMKSNIEAALARYILNWQQKRAYLTRIERRG